jgi:hypothetical protein
MLIFIAVRNGLGAALAVSFLVIVLMLRVALKALTAGVDAPLGRAESGASRLVTRVGLSAVGPVPAGCDPAAELDRR